MVAAPERIRVNCDLRHVNVVLCCDPKAFTHTNPLDGMAEGGCLVWESEEEGEQAWERLPIWARKQIIEKNIRVFTLPGFQIARNATDRGDLQLRMQGNAFLGAFFAVSPLLDEFGITPGAVPRRRAQAVREEVRPVRRSGRDVQHGGHDAGLRARAGNPQSASSTRADRSTLRGQALLPVVPVDGHGDGVRLADAARTRLPRARTSARRSRGSATFDAQFRAGLGYNQPAAPLPSLGVMAAGSGDTASKYVARRETPLYIAENCTQCMECIAVCPDTALPNCSQDLDTVLRTAVTNYVTDAGERQKMLAAHAGDREAHARA